MHAPSSVSVGAGARDPSSSSVIALCMVITIIEGYNLIVFGQVVPLLLRDPALGISDQAIGLIGGIVYIGAILGALAAPLFGERLGRKPVLIVAIAVFALGSTLSGAAVDGSMLGIARFLTGIGGGAALTTSMTVARNSAPPRRASLVVTITMAGIPLGGVVAALVAVPVLPALGWRAMLFIGTGVTLAILVAVSWMKIPTNSEPEAAQRTWSSRHKLAAVFTGRGTAVAVIVALCAIANMVAWQGLNVWVVESMIGEGFALQAALLFSFVLTGAAVLGSFATAWMADRRGASSAAAITATCTVAGMVGMLVLPASVPAAVVSISLMGIGGHSTMNLVHTATSDMYPLPARATALGWSNGTSFVGAFLGPTLGGAAIAAGGSTGIFATFAVAAGVCLVSVVALLIADRKTTHASFRHPQGRHGEPLLTSEVPA
ncbi:aromatic acid/H+ symport family MFS transporter [Arthrobacter ginkgonis]|uniref:Aromatic acid/H+ symport family MFS transporter n=1 Tax=Arthrobacter ginkgonis TaxID=1630594 RepID=A0ABP7CWD6_9MICC